MKDILIRILGFAIVFISLGIYGWLFDIDIPNIPIFLLFPCSFFIVIITILIGLFGILLMCVGKNMFEGEK